MSPFRTVPTEQVAEVEKHRITEQEETKRRTISEREATQRTRLEQREKTKQNTEGYWIIRGVAGVVTIAFVIASGLVLSQYIDHRWPDDHDCKESINIVARSSTPYRCDNGAKMTSTPGPDRDQVTIRCSCGSVPPPVASTVP